MDENEVEPEVAPVLPGNLFAIEFEASGYVTHPDGTTD